MTILEAALKVLQEAGKPLHVDELTQRMLSKGLWVTSGKTPSASVSRCIRRNIRQKGKSSLFVIHSKATFGLRSVDDHSGSDGSTSKRVRRERTERARNGLKFTDAAEMVLERLAEGKPMHYREITSKALEEGWLSTEGKTPEYTMNSRIMAEIKRAKVQGEVPRFTQLGNRDGRFGLSKWLGAGLSREIAEHNKKVRKELHARLLSDKWQEMEDIVAEQLLPEIGFEEIEVTSRSKDGGIDVRGVLAVDGVIRTKMAIQVKRWKKNVPAPIVQQVRGSLGTHEQGLIITTSDFSSGARKEACRRDAVRVALMNGEELLSLLIKYGIGVSSEQHELIKLD